MTDPPVLRLAGDVAAQFAHLPAPEGARLTAEHLRRFWAPEMRQELIALVAAGRVQNERVVAAADLLAGMTSR
jgi:formate dehydrogenase subunit delta